VEWDICEEFDPHAVVEDDEFSDYGDEPYAWLPANKNISQRFTGLDAAPLLTREMWRDDLLSIYGQCDSHQGHKTPHFTQAIDQFLYEQFGFNLQSVADQEGLEPSEKEWKQDAVLFLQDGSLPIDKVYKHPIVNFLGQLFRSAADSEVLDWDLSSSRPGCLRQELVRNVDIVKGTVTAGRSDSHTLYAINPVVKNVEPTAGWTVAVGCPSSALLCVRILSAGLTVDDLVRCLVKRGIPFSTLARDSDPPYSQLPSRMLQPPPYFCGLGVRYPGYKFDAADYMAYEAARDAFFA
jgi:hypothetical protein